MRKGKGKKLKTAKDEELNGQGGKRKKRVRKGVIQPHAEQPDIAKQNH